MLTYKHVFILTFKDLSYGDLLFVPIRKTIPLNVTLKTDLVPHNMSNTWTTHMRTHTLNFPTY